MNLHLLFSFFRALIFSILFVAVSLYAQVPSGYYDAAGGKFKDELKTSLRSIISSGHTSNTYTSLWLHFERTDMHPSGHVWDVYSNCSFQFVTNQCGNYSAECDCYNREHSIPQSWLGSESLPMYADLHHVLPVDGWTNNRRATYPFGRVGSASWTSFNGSKLGSSNYPGYSGVVFEPIDQYKGDFARIMFYMATRYENLLPAWQGNDANAAAVFDGQIWPGFNQWAINLYLQWHEQDPPDLKEISRNDSIFAIQNNRNPFVDYPFYAQMIWGPQASIDEASDILSVFVHPNPGSDKVNVMYKQNFQVLTIFSISGKRIQEILLPVQDIDVSFLEKGLYVFTLSGDNVASVSLRFVKL
jgi:endonuclease I